MIDFFCLKTQCIFTITSLKDKHNPKKRKHLFLVPFTFYRFVCFVAPARHVFISFRTFCSISPKTLGWGSRAAVRGVRGVGLIEIKWDGWWGGRKNKGAANTQPREKRNRVRLCKKSKARVPKQREANERQKTSARQGRATSKKRSQPRPPPRHTRSRRAIPSPTPPLPTRIDGDANVACSLEACRPGLVDRVGWGREGRGIAAALARAAVVARGRKTARLSRRPPLNANLLPPARHPPPATRALAFLSKAAHRPLLSRPSCAHAVRPSKKMGQPPYSPPPRVPRTKTRASAIALF